MVDGVELDTASGAMLSLSLSLAVSIPHCQLRVSDVVDCTLADSNKLPLADSVMRSPFLAAAAASLLRLMGLQPATLPPPLLPAPPQCIEKTRGTAPNEVEVI